ncbi:hypothetical protein [Paracraurococcus ruber]|uniref:Uncharacterized protein n=1 Tax=Paracraurococcus ruber TaxID=77675 RepID=A0ABS1D233_9PROT|nr:hypothetical protein [Paracraurococcus ruber]MBK1660819.1 hypothetical protein [Paracraurococcus ruber]TDG27011.1 hypothetical protein E2C05_24405 [Paracraurococcus ruber]
MSTATTTATTPLATLADADLDAVCGGGTNIVVIGGNGGVAVSGVVVGNITGSYVSIGNGYTGSASANGNISARLSGLFRR